MLIIDLPEGSVREPILVRGEQTWKVQDLKTELAKVRQGTIKCWGGVVNNYVSVLSLRA